MANQKRYLITVRQCEESGVLVGRSENIPGLNIEADTPAGIVEAIVEVAPRLLTSNLGLSPEEVGECLIDVQPVPARSRPQQRPPRPHILVDSELASVTA